MGKDHRRFCGTCHGPYEKIPFPSPGFKLHRSAMAKTTKKPKKKIKKAVKKALRPKSRPKAKTKTTRKPAAVVHLVNCYNCLQDYDPRQGHDCIPLTEKDLLRKLNEDLQDAFQTLRERAADFGEHKVYNNARAIMFSRRVCYMFVRPKKSYLELCFFLPRRETDASIFRVHPVSKSKFSHTYKLIHSDQIEAPLSDWLREAFEFSG